MTYSLSTALSIIVNLNSLLREKIPIVVLSKWIPIVLFFLPYFGRTGSTKFSENWYVKLFDFHQLGTALVFLFSVLAIIFIFSACLKNNHNL